jgi:hypothetical protein
MPRIPPFHWDRPGEKYHDNSRCGPGGEVPHQHRKPGTGNRLHCEHCAKLNAEGK